MSFLRTLIDAWRNRANLGDANIADDELEFLPAALEIQSRPPSPTGRLLMWMLMTLFLIGVLWACFGKVNIVAVAEGRIIPSGKVKPIQPLEKGVVSRILVTEGQRIGKGDPLVELDATQTQADEQRLRQELLTTTLDMTRQHLLVNRLTTESSFNQAIEWPREATEEQRRFQQQLLEQQWIQYRAQVEALQRSLTAKQAEQDASRARIERLSVTLPLVTERTEALKKLSERKMAARIQYLELEAERVKTRQELIEERAVQRQLQAAVAEIEARMETLEAQTRSQTLEELAASRRQIAALKEELAKAKDLNQRQILYSPVEGTVKELVLASQGEVVTPAQTLMQIVPDDDALVVEAYLANKDIGFVHESMPAAIKIDTFPFTKYGLIEAKVIQVSADAIADEERGLIYKMRLLMDKDWLDVEGSRVKLIPGMTVTAEVKTGTRRLIEYFLAPLLRYRQESVRER
ncbi:HlyD family type I secretion periplasmic adaptor subunit [Marinobacterium sp. D7]|uniref:HlyD family type I secretion periplasmic adaptor subunit n=1 Tax=Marinobacterium ramblicola TaxID=2849041 RepID=UPI001C2D3DD8|nr:HlyD family type I secretion periplasmic adaptor subunit [Marinobacterium ramblicola]MBV1790595.1 HlyD family type I secretion periplasmic adaptor subunit [Marinobacterium ramblicola]